MVRADSLRLSDCKTLTISELPMALIDLTLQVSGRPTPHKFRTCLNKAADTTMRTANIQRVRVGNSDAETPNHRRSGSKVDMFNIQGWQRQRCCEGGHELIS